MVRHFELIDLDLLRQSAMSEKRTHRELSDSVKVGQFSTQSGLNNLTG